MKLRFEKLEGALKVETLMERCLQSVIGRVNASSVLLVEVNHAQMFSSFLSFFLPQVRAETSLIFANIYIIILEWRF